MDEKVAVLAAKAGDQQAFADLFHHYYPMIHAYAYRLCLRPADAQDIAQETFIKAARALCSYEPEMPFRHWLYRICTNTARDWMRSHGRRQQMEDAATARAKLDESVRHPDYEIACEALERLPDDLRMAVVLVFFEEMSHAEAAKVLGCAETTISWRIFTAKRKLKTLLRRHE